MYRIMAINPGSTSTKIGFFEDDTCITETNIPFVPGKKREKAHILDEFEERMATIRAFLDKNQISLESIDLFSSRASTPETVGFGAYVIDSRMVRQFCFNPNSRIHPSSLSPLLAYALASSVGKPAIFYDAVSANRANEVAKASGIPGVRRLMGAHNLNTRMVARELAQSTGRLYEDCKFVVAHLGGGMSISAHDHGIIVDSVMSDEGPMAPQRTGRLSFIQMTEMCFSGKYTRDDMMKMTSSGGLLSYLKAADMQEVEKRIHEGDEKALYYYNVMAYQVAKSIGEMFAALSSEANAIILTGGIAHSEMFTGLLKGYVGRLAPVKVIPGEREMLALARGGLRVLRGEEAMQKYDLLPEGFDSLEQMEEDFKKRRPDLLQEEAVKWVLSLEG